MLTSKHLLKLPLPSSDLYISRLDLTQMKIDYKQYEKDTSKLMGVYTDDKLTVDGDRLVHTVGFIPKALAEHIQSILS